MPVYLDCNATTPVEPRVLEVLRQFTAEDFGNEGSRTHEFGALAKRAVQKARDQVGAVVAAGRDEVVFTSGATESNNLALLGLGSAALEQGRRHVLSTPIEHKAVLEPLEELHRRGLEVEMLPIGPGGFLNPEDLAQQMRPDTFLVSIMHVNNETGIRQPLDQIAEVMDKHPAYLHTDAAQGFGKDLAALQNPRLDLISISGHKIYGPKGIGALITRRRGYDRPPLKPLFFGGGQERGLRPGTLPVALIASLGAAAEIALAEHADRREVCKRIRKDALEALFPLSPRFSGATERTIEHVLNVSFSDLDSEAVIVALKDIASISNGSACTSASYAPSHVLRAMGMSDDEANSCIRFSWSHLTENVDWRSVADRIRSLL